MVVDLLLRHHLLHLAQTLARLGFRRLHLLAQRRDLILKMAQELDGLHQDVDLALADHGTGGLRVKRSVGSAYGDDRVELLDLRV